MQVGQRGEIRLVESVTVGILIGDLTEVLPDEGLQQQIVRATLEGQCPQSVDDVGHVVVSAQESDSVPDQSDPFNVAVCTTASA